MDVHGWHDLAAGCTNTFLLDRHDPDDDASAAAPRRRKKPWRYRWPDAFRGALLAQLLGLNAQLAFAENLARAAKRVKAWVKAAGGWPTDGVVKGPRS